MNMLTNPCLLGQLIRFARITGLNNKRMDGPERQDGRPDGPGWSELHGPILMVLVMMVWSLMVLALELVDDALITLGPLPISVSSRILASIK